MTSALSPRVAVRAQSSWRVYWPIALLSIGIALLGFWPTYYGVLLLSGSVHALPIIHVHAAVFTGWLLLVLAQAALAATGHTAMHIKLGKVGFVYGALLILVGETTAFVSFGARVAAGNISEARTRLFAPVTDMMGFAPFLVAAWLYRRKPEIHKRLIVVATTILLIAAVHRIAIFGAPPPPLPFLLVVWLSPILVGMTFDLARRGVVHPVYLAGIGMVLVLKFLRRPLARSDAWHHFLDWLVTVYS